jgi:murein DD-endopeptidase MepM/ murein hydrolase activator NlpD
MSARRWHRASLRSVAAFLGFIVLATIGSWVSAPTHGRDLSGPITAVRASQLAAEASMRAADKRLKSLKRNIKGAERRLRRARRRHDEKIEQRSQARAQVRDIHDQLQATRDALEGQEVALATLNAQRAILRPIAPAAALSAGARGDDPERGPLEGYRPPQAEGSGSTLARLEDTVADLESDVARIEDVAKRIERSTRKVERETRRVARRERKAKHRVRMIRAGIRASTAQQRGSEASLAAHIHSMTRLAYLRARKKTKGKQRPSFIMPVRARLTQGFHAGHDGLDLAAGQGTPIRAMGQGVIAYVGWNPWDSRPRAFVVVIAHQGGYETKYGHLLPRRGVTLGKLVRRGEVIGYMGDTGHATGVHLHLEVSRGFHTLNPYSVL